MEKNVEELYREREKRFTDAIELKVPDRVPVTASFYFFPARYYGCTMKEMMYDPGKLMDLHLKAVREFEPDVAQNPFGQLFLGPLLETLDYRQMQWPGGQLGPDVPYQFVEGEYMSAAEYDHLFSDPMDFVVRKYWPRISGSLKGLEKLTPFSDFTSSMSYHSFGIFGEPEMVKALDTLKQAGQETRRIGTYARRFVEILKEEGIPSQGGGQTSAPFDFLGDTLRGTKGLMLDMYRRPETVVKACEWLLPILARRGVNSGKASQTKVVFIALHKGLDGFMSPEQFNKFYWPTLRDLALTLIREGLTPYLFWEGDCTSRPRGISRICRKERPYTDSKPRT